MYTIEKHAGRLIEARLAAPLTPNDVQSIVQRVRMLVLSLPGKAVCCIDVIQLDVLPEEAVGAFVALFTRDNPKVERSGFLLARSVSAFGMQVQRMIRSASSPNRRTFDDRAEMQSWLSEVLDPLEQEQLSRFLAATDIPEPSSVKSSRRAPSVR